MGYQEKSMFRRLKDAVAGSLPYEVIFQYMIHLDPKELQEACNINPAYKSVCDDAGFWRAKIDKDYPGYSVNCSRPTETTSSLKQCWIKLYMGTKFEVETSMKVNRSFEYRFKRVTKKVVETHEEPVIDNEEFRKNVEEMATKNYPKFKDSIQIDSSDQRLSSSFACKMQGEKLHFILIKMKDQRPVRGFTGTEKKRILENVNKLFDSDSSSLDVKYQELKDREIFYGPNGRKVTERMYLDKSPSNKKFIKVVETRQLVAKEEQSYTYDENYFVPNPENFVFPDR